MTISESLIDAGPVRAHVALLVRAAGSLGEVSRHTGIPRTTLQCQNVRIALSTAQQILAVTPDDVTPGPIDLDPAVLEALETGGHVKFIGPLNGTKPAYVWALHHKGWTNTHIAAAVRASNATVNHILEQQEPPVSESHTEYTRMSTELDNARQSADLWKEAHAAAMQREDSWREIALTTQAVLNEVREYNKTVLHCPELDHIIRRETRP